MSRKNPQEALFRSVSPIAVKRTEVERSFSPVQSSSIELLPIAADHPLIALCKQWLAFDWCNKVLKPTQCEELLNLLSNIRHELPDYFTRTIVPNFKEKDVLMFQLYRRVKDEPVGERRANWIKSLEHIIALDKMIEQQRQKLGATVYEAGKPTWDDKKYNKTIEITLDDHDIGREYKGFYVSSLQLKHGIKNQKSDWLKFHFVFSEIMWQFYANCRWNYNYNSRLFPTDEYQNIRVLLSVVSRLEGHVPDIASEAVFQCMQCSADIRYAFYKSIPYAGSVRMKLLLDFSEKFQRANLHWLSSVPALPEPLLEEDRRDRVQMYIDVFKWTADVYLGHLGSSGHVKENPILMEKALKDRSIWRLIRLFITAFRMPGTDQALLRLCSLYGEVVQADRTAAVSSGSLQFGDYLESSLRPYWKGINQEKERILRETPEAAPKPMEAEECRGLLILEYKYMATAYLRMVKCNPEASVESRKLTKENAAAAAYAMLDLAAAFERKEKSSREVWPALLVLQQQELKRSSERIGGHDSRLTQLLNANPDIKEYLENLKAAPEETPEAEELTATAASRAVSPEEKAKATPMADQPQAATAKPVAVRAVITPRKQCLALFEIAQQYLKKSHSCWDAPDWKKMWPASHNFERLICSPLVSKALEPNESWCALQLIEILEFITSEQWINRAAEYEWVDALAEARIILNEEAIRQACFLEHVRSTQLAEAIAAHPDLKSGLLLKKDVTPLPSSREGCQRCIIEQYEAMATVYLNTKRDDTWACTTNAHSLSQFCYESEATRTDLYLQLQTAVESLEFEDAASLIKQIQAKAPDPQCLSYLSAMINFGRASAQAFKNAYQMIRVAKRAEQEGTNLDEILSELRRLGEAEYERCVPPSLLSQLLSANPFLKKYTARLAEIATATVAVNGGAGGLSSVAQNSSGLFASVPKESHVQPTASVSNLKQ